MRKAARKTLTEFSLCCGCFHFTLLPPLSPFVLDLPLVKNRKTKASKNQQTKNNNNNKNKLFILLGAVSQHEMPETQVKLVRFATERKNNSKKTTEHILCKTQVPLWHNTCTHTERKGEKRKETEAGESLCGMRVAISIC